MAASSVHNGWRWDPANSRLDMYYRGTRVGAVSAAGVQTVAAFTATTSVDATTSVSAGTTVTGGTGVIATTGGVTATAGDVKATAGNFRGGVLSAFATTEPTSAVVLKTGTAPAGAITTSCGMFTDGTTMKKIIAASTVSDIQT